MAFFSFQYQNFQSFRCPHMSDMSGHMTSILLKHPKSTHKHKNNLYLVFDMNLCDMNGIGQVLKCI